MSDSLRILTFNTQLRSWGMEVLADSWLFPSETAEPRAKLIAANVLASAHDYDIICFNEVFDEDARAILISDLSGQYPYAVTKADVGGIEVAWPGKPVLPVNPVALLMGVTGASFISSWIGLGAPKLEDSGLMMFSRWPFALEPITQAMADLLDPLTLSELMPGGLPRVAFMPYVASTGGDAMASKGIVYVHVERDASHSYHVFATHTQADDKSLGEHRPERDQQVNEGADFIVHCAGAPPFGKEVFFLGDFNINGGQANVPAAPETDEWGKDFWTAADLLSNHMIDAWGRWQCTGAPGGLRDRGTTAPTVYPPPEQRLDYVFRSATSALAVQHLYIDYDLATVPPGIDGVSYMSDHRPLGCDLNHPQPNCTPPEALAAIIDASGQFRDRGLRLPAGVKWFVFNEKGTYEFHVDSSRFTVRFEIYLDSDLSRPRQQYREEFQPDFGIRYVIPSAPFLVKVFCTDRKTEYDYDFRAHRHRGTSVNEAIDLVPENDYAEAFPASQLIGADPVAPWDSTDSKWFRLDTPRTGTNGAIELGIDVTLKNHADSGALLFIARMDMNGMLKLLKQDGPSDGFLRARWSARVGERFIIAVQRRDRGGVPVSFDIVPRSNVNILLGGKTGTPRLVCQDETSGWGSDDIAMSVEVDGATVRDISNDEIGDFDQDDVRDLDQWIPETVVYLDHVGVTVIEEDDIDPDDVGTGRIPSMGALPGAPGITIDDVSPDGTARVRLHIDVDDGTYEFRASVTRWHEKA